MIIKHKTVIALAFCVLFGFFAMSCGKSHPDPKVESLQITPANPSIPAGGSQPMTVTAVYEDGTTGDVTSKVSWSSSDIAVVTVSADGVITPTFTGDINTQPTATITAMYGFNVLTFTVTIIPAQIFDIAISPVNNTGTSIANGTSAFYNATAYLTDGDTLDITGSLTTIWNSSDTGVAAIPIFNATSNPPWVSTIGTGVGPSDPDVDVTISVQYTTSSTTFSDSIMLTVTPAELSSISVGPASASIAKGTSQQFTATGVFGDGSTQTLTTQVTWNSNSPTVATIDANGLASSLSEGATIINAVDSGTGITSGNATLTVTPAVLDAITVTASDPSVPKGSTRQVSAIGTFTDSSTQDITSLVTTWASSAPGIANVSSTGLVTGENQGSALINAVYSGIVASDSGGDLLFTVNDKELVSIAVIPSVVNIPEGGATFQFDAEGTFTDSSTEIITSQVGIWSSDKPGIANVVSGLATSGTQGTALINAAYSGSLSPGRTVVASDTLGEATLNVVPSGTVMPLYNTNGADWNDYVVNDGPDRFNASDSACNPAVDTSCLHGGEMRMVKMPSSLSSCAGLSAADGLGAFDWTCDSTTSPLRMVSTGLRDGVNLSNLLDFSVTPPMWKENSVTATDSGGTVVLKTTDAIWWTNTIVQANFSLNNSNTTSGNIYVITSNPSAPHTIEKDNIALVVKPGVTLTGSSFADQTIVSVNSSNFIWIEGTIDASGDKYGIYLANVDFSVLRNIDVSNASSLDAVGISLSGSSHNKLTDVSASNNASTGVYFGSFSDNNEVKNITASNNSYGVAIVNSSGNIAIDTIASNNGYSGVYLCIATDNTLSDVTTANNDDSGVYLFQSSYNTLTNLTSSNNNGTIGSSAAVFLDTSDYNTLANVTASNSPNGVVLNNSSNTELANLAAANNTNGINIVSGSSVNAFSGMLEVGSNSSGNCIFTFSSGTKPGLVETTCTTTGLDGSNNYGINNSSATFYTTGVDFTSSFVGKVTTDDTVNASDSSGSSLYDSITDWDGFENSYRGWGLESLLAFPDASNRGQCTTGITCRIWDWSLSTGDTVIKDMLSVPTGNDILTHTWSDLSTTTFLRNAVEIAGDNIGNDNTLCESDETCLYTPNIGSYQGHGSLIDAAYIGFSGILQNIALKSYSTNGR